MDNIKTVVTGYHTVLL